MRHKTHVWQIVMGVSAAALLFMFGYYSAYTKAMDDCNVHYRDCRQDRYPEMVNTDWVDPGHAVVDENMAVQNLTIDCMVREVG